MPDQSAVQPKTGKEKKMNESRIITVPNRKALKQWYGAVKRDKSLPPGTTKLAKYVVDNAQYDEVGQCWKIVLPEGF